MDPKADWCSGCLRKRTSGFRTLGAVTCDSVEQCPQALFTARDAGQCGVAPEQSGQWLMPGMRMPYDEGRALELLRMGSGIPGAQFREGQSEAIRHVVEGAGRLLVVQKTGWGKSFVYFIGTRQLRDAGSGPALLISPLISLMRNQIAAAERMGVRAVTINSDNTDEWEDVEVRLRNDEVDILLISPERLANEGFRERVLQNIARKLSLLVVDEAHCISDWGHDFRPDYRLLERIAANLPENLRLLATTATANDRVTNDLKETLGPNLHVMRGDLSRPSLMLQTIRLPSQAERLAWIAERLEEIPGSGIIYTLTVRDADRVASWLQSSGHDVRSYTARSKDREGLEQLLLKNQVKALVATTALGMGFDKPDLAFVIHYQTPGSVTAYYQQVGRAGRGRDAAYGVLLSGTEDTDITDHFINSAFPTECEVNLIVGALEDEPEGLSVPQLLKAVNISQRRIEQTIKLLSLESPAPIAKVETKWQLTSTLLSEEFWERARRLTELRREEQRQMQQYVALETGHMEFLIGALDGPPGATAQSDLAPLPETISKETIEDAIRFLRRSSLDIQPRRQWPAGGLPKYGVRGSIQEEYRAKVGKALCIWGDAGWGRLVRSGKYEQGRFSDELVEASVALIEEWSPDPMPTWVTCIPSSRHPSLVPEFARRLARRLGLPFSASLVRTDERPAQKEMANPTQQALNVDGSLDVVEAGLLRGPVLLVDDMVDSRWTLAIASWLLRKGGCQEVWPFALADTGAGQG